MEKDIEILEDNKDMFIDTLYECYRQSAVKPFEKALENLINRVKELEKYEEYYRDMEEVNKKFIAVDKIKEKIEEVDNYGDTESVSPPYYITKKGAEIFKADAELILQELLEEE